MSGTDRETNPEVRNWSGDPPGGLELVGRPSWRSRSGWETLWRSGTGRETLPEVRKSSVTHPEVLKWS